MATKKASKAPRKKGSTGGKLNYLLVGSDGKMYLVSGIDGRTRALTKAEITSKAVRDALKARQDAGLALSKALEKEGFPLADTLIVDFPPGG
jgi:hypothetical protein